MSEDSFKFLEIIFEDRSSPNTKPNAHQTDDDERGFCTFAEAIIHTQVVDQNGYYESSSMGSKVDKGNDLQLSV